MTDSNGKKNVDAPVNTGNSSTNNVNTSPTSDPIDELFYSVFQQRIEQDKKHKSKTFIGICLGFELITTDQCIIETSEDFYTSIDKDYIPYAKKDVQISESYRLEKLEREKRKAPMTKALAEGLNPGTAAGAGIERAIEERKSKRELEKKKLKKTKQLYRARVYIPEMMGFLPMLTEKEVNLYNSYKKAPPPENTKQAQEFEYFKRIIDRIPVFYSLADKPPQVLKKVRVEFPDQTYMFYGKYLGTV